MGSEKVWVSNVMRKTDPSWVDYNLSVKGKIEIL